MKLACDRCKIKLNPLCHCYSAVSEFDVTGIHCSVTHKGHRALTNEQGGEQQSHAAPQKHPALLPHLHCELWLYRAILASFISAITTSQYIIRTAWAKPTALHKTTATLKLYVTGRAQAFEDSPETEYRRLCIVLQEKAQDCCLSSQIAQNHGEHLLEAILMLVLCAYFQRKTTSAPTKNFKDLYPSTWHQYKGDEQNVPSQASVLYLTVVSTPSHSEARLSTEILTTAQRFPVWYYEKVINLYYIF